MLSVKIFRCFIDILYFFFGHGIKEFIYGYRFDVNSDDDKRGESFFSKFLEDITEDCDNDDDSYVLEDCFVGLPKNILKIQGEIGFYNTRIRGLKTLERNYTCSMKNLKEKRIIANLRAKSLCFYSEFHVKLSSFERAIILQGTLEDIAMIWDFSISSQTGRDGILHSLYIHEIKGMKILLYGLGILTYPINVFTDLAIRVMKSFARNCIEYKIENYMYEQLKKYQFPTEGMKMAPCLKNADACYPEFLISPKKESFAEEDSNSEKICGSTDSAISNKSLHTLKLSEFNDEEFCDWKFARNPVKLEGMIELKCLTRKTSESTIPAEMSPTSTNNLKYSNLNETTEKTFPKCLQVCESDPPKFSNKESLKRKIPNIHESSEFINQFSPTKYAKYANDECSIIEEIQHEQSKELSLEHNSEMYELSEVSAPEEISFVECIDLVHEVEFSEFFEKLKTSSLEHKNEIKGDDRSTTLNELERDEKLSLLVEHEFQHEVENNSELLDDSVDDETDSFLEEVKAAEMVFQGAISVLENSAGKVNKGELDGLDRNIKSLDMDSSDE